MKRNDCSKPRSHACARVENRTESVGKQVQTISVTTKTRRARSSKKHWSEPFVSFVIFVVKRIFVP